MKLYIIKSGYYSDHSGNDSIDAICSSHERALCIIQKNFRKLEQEKNRKTGELIDCWSDGDYWVNIGEGYLDSECYHTSQEEIDNWSKNEKII